MIFQAIVTRYMGPTNRRSGRIKATASAGSVTLEYEHGLGIEANHARAAEALAVKLKWSGHWYGGGMPKDSGHVYVSSGPTDDTCAFVTTGEF